VGSTVRRPGRIAGYELQQFFYFVTKGLPSSPTLQNGHRDGTYEKFCLLVGFDDHHRYILRQLPTAPMTAQNVLAL
jgi:hypothetical protein